MASSVSKQLKQLTKKLEKDLQKALSRKDLKAMGDLAAQTIVQRTRRGKGVKRPRGNITSLKALSKGYVSRRRQARLSRFTSPSKSNLTFTGKLLGSIKVTKIIVRGTKRGIVISPKPNKRSGEKLTNQKSGAFVSVARPFFNLGKAEVREISAEIAERIRKNLK